MPNCARAPTPDPREPAPAGGRFRPRFRSGAPYLVPLAAAALAAAGFWVFRRELVSAGSSLSLESPETQVTEALAHQTRAHLEDVYGFRAGGTAELVPVRYAEVLPVVEGGTASVVALLDAEGRVRWRDQAAALSYLGREQFHMKPCGIALWCAGGDQFSRLRGVLRTLFRRLDAEEAGDGSAYAALVADDYRDAAWDRAGVLEKIGRELAASPRPRVRVLAWQIRVDRDGAEVGEDREVSAPGRGSRPSRARYRLVRRGERWLFAAGL